MERADFEQWRSREVARLLALVESERRYYQEIVAALPVPVAALSADLGLVYANRAFRQTLELRTEELPRRTIGQILLVPELEARIREARAEGKPGAPMQYERAGRAFRIAIVPLRPGDDEADTLLLMEDAGGVPAAAPAEPVAPARTALGPEVPAVVWEADAATLTFRSVGGDAESLLGYPAQHWMNTPGFFEERMHPEDRAATAAFYKEALAKGGDATAEYRALARGGEAVWCRETIRAVATEKAEEGRTVTGVIVNITGRKELERHLLAAARIEALVTLAGRLVHDLNNPLMIVAGYGEELLNALPGQSPARGDVTEILAASRRIASLAAQLNEFVRRPPSVPSRVNLSELLPALESRVAGAAGAAVSLALPAEPVWAVAEPRQLGEIVLALASGAREGAQGRSRLTVAWNATTLAERIGTGPIAPGRYAVITVSDDSRGADANRLAALFETVLPEKDTASPAAAISRAYTRVRDWGGSIAVDAGPGGTVFSVYLPLAEPETESDRAAASLAIPSAAAPLPPAEQFRETILVVDDEAGIRGLVRKILRRERYQVLEAGSAEEALAISVSHPDPIHLLLTDVVLPGLSGPELARRMYEASPNLKVLYVSGYTDDDSVRAGEYPPGSRFLPKPFTLGALLASVRETLDAT
jgi:hypothetical protein